MHISFTQKRCSMTGRNKSFPGCNAHRDEAEDLGDPERLANQSSIFQEGGLKDTGATTEHFRNRLNIGEFRWTVLEE